MNLFRLLEDSADGRVELVEQIVGRAGADAIIHFSNGTNVQVPGLLVSYRDPGSSIVRSGDLFRARTWIELGFLSLTHCAEIENAETGETYYFENGGRAYLELRRAWVD